MRTTIDLDPLVLRALKKRQREEGRTLGQVASELLARALREELAVPEPSIRWHTTAAAPVIDLYDTAALQAILDEDGPR